jgi:hypothetical protein
MPNHLVLFALGKQEFYRQALFLIVSTIAFKKDSIQFHVYSDKTDWIPEALSPALNCILLSEQQIKILKGETDFIHRAKILLIKDVCSKVSGNVLYIDSDCYLQRNLDKLYRQISEGKFIMHMHHFVLRNCQDKSINQVVKAAIDNGLIMEKETAYSMWNAGVIGGKASTLLSVCNEALCITDSLLKYASHHTVEQFAFSVCLQRREAILPAQRAVHHYWDSSEKKFMDSYLKLNSDKLAQTSNKLYSSMSRKIYFNLFSLRIKTSYIFSRDRAYQHLESNEFMKGYWFISKAFFSQFMLDDEFQRTAKFHAIRHIKHIAKLIIDPAVLNKFKIYGKR